MRARSVALVMRVFDNALPGRIDQEMLIPFTEEIPQWTKSPKPASGNHCASGRGLSARAHGDPAGRMASAAASARVRLFFIRAPWGVVRSFRSPAGRDK